MNNSLYPFLTTTQEFLILLNLRWQKLSVRPCALPDSGLKSVSVLIKSIYESTCFATILPYCRILFILYMELKTGLTPGFIQSAVSFQPVVQTVKLIS